MLIKLRGLATLLLCIMNLDLDIDEGLSLDNKDEVKKKVTFAMVQSPSADSVASMGSLNNNNTDNSNNILLISPAHEVVFSASATGDLVAKLQIQNVSSKPVGYKIKTTSPEKYRVRPSTGSLAPSLSATVEIHCAAAAATPASAPVSLVRDKFLITAIFLDTAELSGQQLTEALKTSKPDSQYRLRCQVAGAGAGQGGVAAEVTSATPTTVFPATELDQNRQMANIIRKVTLFIFSYFLIFLMIFVGQPNKCQARGACISNEAVYSNPADSHLSSDTPPSDLIIFLQYHNLKRKVSAPLVSSIPFIQLLKSVYLSGS